MSNATAALGTQLKRGDGGTGAGTKASRIMGTSNGVVKVEALAAGTAGNAIYTNIVVSGNNTALSVVVTGNQITFNSATDGSGVATSKANDLIAAFYETAAARALAECTNGAGDGTGVVTAAALQALSGGAAGGEAFTLVAGIKDIKGPARSRSFTDVTSHDSTGGYREFIPSLKEGGSVSCEGHYAPTDAQHTGLNTDYENGVLRNFQVVFPTTPNKTFSFAAYVENFEVGAPLEGAIPLSFSLKISGPVTIS